MTDKEVFQEQVATALKAYQENDIKGAYQLIKMHEDHAALLQVTQKAYSIQPGQWRLAVNEWINVACQQMRIQLGLDAEGCLIKPLAVLALKTALSLFESAR